MNLYLTVQDTCSDYTIDLDRHLQFVSTVLAAALETDTEVSISLVDDLEIRRLNLTYRGIDASTDVLSFSMREGEPVGQNHVLGDIVISVETASRQAGEYNHSLDDEIDELLFHGLLHLLGYDHDSELAADWNQKERRLIDTLERQQAVYTPMGLKPFHESNNQRKGGCTDAQASARQNMQ